MTNRGLVAKAVVLVLAPWAHAQAGPPAAYRPHASVAAADREFAVVHERALQAGLGRALRGLQDWTQSRGRADAKGDADRQLAPAVAALAVMLGDAAIGEQLVRAALLPAAPARARPRPDFVGTELPAALEAAAASNRGALAPARAQHAAASRLLAGRQALRDWLADFADLHGEYLVRVAPASRYAPHLRSERATQLAMWRASHAVALARLTGAGAQAASTAADQVFGAVSTEVEPPPWRGSMLAAWQDELAAFLSWDDDASDVPDDRTGAVLVACARLVVDGFLEADAELFRRLYGSTKHLGAATLESVALELALVEAARGTTKRGVEQLERLRKTWRDREDGALDHYFVTSHLARVRAMGGDHRGAAKEWQRVRELRGAAEAALPKTSTLVSVGLRRMIDRAADTLAFADSLAADGQRPAAVRLLESDLAGHLEGAGRLRLLLGGPDAPTRAWLADRVERLLADADPAHAERVFGLASAVRSLHEERVRLLDEVAAAGDDGLVQQLLFVLLHDRGEDLMRALAIDRRWNGDRSEPPPQAFLLYDETLVERLLALPGVQRLVAPVRAADTVRALPPREALVLTAGHRQRVGWQDGPAAGPQLGARYAAFVATGTGVRRIDLGAARALQLGCQALRDRCLSSSSGNRGRHPTDGAPVAAEDPNLASLRDGLRPLFDALPRDLDTLWVAADGALASVPWEVMLVDAGWTEPPAVRHVSGPLAMVARPASNAAPRLLAFGNVAFDDPPQIAGTPPADAARGLARVIGLAADVHWPRLPGAARERDEVERRFRAAHPDGEVWNCDGAHANAHYLYGLLPKVRYAHLATHAFVTPEPLWGTTGGRHGEQERDLEALRRARAGIVLAGANRHPQPGGREMSIVTAAELATLDLRSCELIVLSACNTNVGARSFGQGLTGLNAALLSAGARHTITTLWQVDDVGAERFFAAFYDRLWQNREDLAAAFRGAQRDRRQAGDPASMWAAFVLTSNGR
ncbi:MAG: CHAT domain-containing protein [Planctomycetes bacterium]|nr:CHAT domain-containing protein [Planctomycetota bacterium]